MKWWPWRQGGQLFLLLAGCCFVSGLHNTCTIGHNRDSGTDSLATVPRPCRKNGGRGGKGGALSLSLAGPKEATKARGGNCPGHVLSKALFIQQRNPRCCMTGAHNTSSRCQNRINCTDSQAREGNCPCSCPWQVQRWPWSVAW